MFFVSVGMLVDPALLVEYWLPIIVLIIVTIAGKLIFPPAACCFPVKICKLQFYAVSAWRRLVNFPSLLLLWA